MKQKRGTCAHQTSRQVRNYGATAPVRDRRRKRWSSRSIRPRKPLRRGTAQLLVGDRLMLDFVVEFLQIADAVDNDPVEHQRNYLAARSFPVAPKRITFTAAICRRS